MHIYRAHDYLAQGTITANAFKTPFFIGDGRFH